MLIGITARFTSNEPITRKDRDDPDKVGLYPLFKKPDLCNLWYKGKGWRPIGYRIAACVCSSRQVVRLSWIFRNSLSCHSPFDWRVNWMGVQFRMVWQKIEIICNLSGLSPIGGNYRCVFLPRSGLLEQPCRYQGPKKPAMCEYYHHRPNLALIAVL